jgi:predicted PurR-regulated permease PerM
VTTRSDAGALLLKSTLAAAGLVLAASLLWLLRSLIVPVAVSGLLAYVCRPLVTGLERYRLPRALAVAALLIAFVVVVAGAVGGARAVMPTELGIIQFKVRLLYALNERYETLMGLDRSLTRGNRIYQWLHADLDPFVDNAAELLSLSADERAKLLASRDGAATPAVSDAILSEDRANAQTLEKRARASRAAPDERRSPQAARGGLSTSLSFARSGTLIEALSVWLIAPLVFLFLIRDRGEIKHGLLSLVPNALFEPALTVMSDVDDAVGDWVRGLLLECCLLGITLMLLLAVAGIPWRWAVAIGLIGGASNVVPYLGVVVAMVAGLAYALVGEGLRPLLPIMGDGDYVVPWVIAAVALAELLKNVIYEPVVLGDVVKLHPLVIVLGAAGGAILFGFAGVLLAIPVIVIFKVFVSSAARQLKAYGFV